MPTINTEGEGRPGEVAPAMIQAWDDGELDESTSFGAERSGWVLDMFKWDSQEHLLMDRILDMKERSQKSSEATE